VVDRTAIKTNQAVIIGVCVIAALAHWPAVVGLGALLLALGAALPQASPVGVIYLRWLRPSGLLHPRLVAESSAPHRFAQVLGATCLAAAWTLLTLRIPGFGWALVWLVAVLAAVNLTAGFCAGCEIYSLLGRAGLLAPACPIPPGRSGTGQARSPAGPVTVDPKEGVV
jgi:hypothetical protein